MYATTLLYWGARYQSVDMHQFKFILEEMESYPEAILHVAYKQTPMHAACLARDGKKLELMLADFDKRHEINRVRND